VKKEPPSAPPTRGRSGGALVIREGARTSSPPTRGRKRKPRKEDAAAVAASDLAAAEATRAEYAALREAIARSLEDLVPADNAMPMDAALARSRQDWEREETEQRRRLLDLAAARRRRHHTMPEECRSSSWRTPVTTTGTDRCRHASATLDRGPAVGPPARAASRRRHHRTAMTPGTTAAFYRRLGM
jgi:hypothetical protein